MIRIRCLVCREAFRWDATHGMPEHCPICTEYIGSDGKDEVAAPAIATFKGKNPDRLYRDMEAKSEFRASQAAELTGMSSAEVAHLKMTDMKTGMREGDTAAVNNLTATQQTMFNAMTPDRNLGMVASQGTSQGPLPKAGTNYIQNVLKQNHGRNYRAPVSDMTAMGIQVPDSR